MIEVLTGIVLAAIVLWFGVLSALMVEGEHRVRHGGRRVRLTEPR